LTPGPLLAENALPTRRVCDHRECVDLNSGHKGLKTQDRSDDDEIKEHPEADHDSGATA
jgi:hypothetical protein